MPARYHNAHRHDPYFYRQILTVLIASRASKQTTAQTATALNESGLNTPTGQVWACSHVRQVLKALRNHERYQSRLHTALMAFVFAGTFSVVEALSILKYTSPQQ